METGAEAIVRVPFPNSGPRHLTTASEVATMEFVRSRFGFPLPKIYAWDSSHDNAVSWEYIIMERCSGENLASHVDEVAQSAHIIHSLAMPNTTCPRPNSPNRKYILQRRCLHELRHSCPLYAPGVPYEQCSKRFNAAAASSASSTEGNAPEWDLDCGP